MKQSFAGIYPPITTPFNKEGGIDYQALKANIERWNQTDLAGFVVLGSNGEYVFLDEQEKLKVVKVVVETAAADKKVIAGTGCESTVETIKLSNAAADFGVDGVLLVTPNYYAPAMSDEVIFQHYQKAADRVKVPILLYNVPKFTGLNLPAGLVSKCAQHPNIVGIKDSSGNISQLSEIISSTPEDFNVLVGTASVLSSAVGLGAVGGILALANIAPRESVHIMQLVQSGEYEQARQLQLKLLPVNKAVTATYGIPGLKHALDLLGYKGGFPRSPLLPLSEEKRSQLEAVLYAGGLLQNRSQ